MRVAFPFARKNSSPARRIPSLTALILSLPIFALVLSAHGRLAFGHDVPSSGPDGRVDGLTNTLLGLSAQYQHASPSDRIHIAGLLLSAAVSRYQLLASLMEADPAEVLRVTLPAAIRATLPSAVKAYVEEEVDVEGVLEVVHEDGHSGSRYLYVLETAVERLSLYFAAEPPDLLTGVRVRVRGVRINRTLALAGGNNSVQTVSSTLPNALGARRTLLILVNFADAPTQPYAPDDARNVLFGTTSQFYLENSFEQTWLTGDVLGWFTIAANSTDCDTFVIANQAKSAATAAGIDLAAYAHYVYAFPQNDACHFWGRSTVGGNPSEAWINGEFELGVTAHELGHGLGLFHSHSLDCGAATLGSSCTAYEYGNTLDMMGASASAHYNAFQKERLGWLNAGASASPPITTVLAAGTYSVESYESPGLGPKALKILKSTDPTTGRRTWYYVEARQAIGFDEYLSTNPNVMTGVLIHFGTESYGNSSYLLDMTPESGSSIYWDWKDPALVVGQSFQDPQAGVTLTTESVSDTGATVTVRFDEAMTISSDRASYTRTQSVTIKATLRAGGTPVANVNVAFTVTKANGDLVTGSATTGSNGTATYKLRLRRDDPVGTYRATGAANPSGTPGAATSFTVQ